MKKQLLFTIVILIIIPRSLLYSQYISVINGSNPACIGNYITLGVFYNSTTPASASWDTFPQNTPVATYTSKITVEVTKTIQQYRVVVNNGGGVLYFTVIGNTTPQAFTTNIIGETTVCQGQQGLTYEQPENVNTNFWVWTYPAGFSGPATTITPINNSVNCGVNAVSGNITVSRQNACGTGPAKLLYVNVNPKPVIPIISHTANVLTSDAVSGNQWYNQNGLILGATNQSFTPIVIGNYYVIVTNSSGCSSDISNTLNVAALGIENYKLNNSIQIYPNSVKNNITIDFGNLTDILDYKIKITNLLGQEVYYKNIETSKTFVPISWNGQGMYIVNVIDAQGHTINVKKIILQ